MTDFFFLVLTYATYYGLFYCTIGVVLRQCFSILFEFQVIRKGCEAGADPEIFERGGPEAIIYKILERGGPKSHKMAFECLFQSFSYKSFANVPPKGGARAPWAPPLNPPL